MTADFTKFFDIEYGPKLGIRASTFRAVIREAIAQKVTTIVETGCMRQTDNWAGDGQSTLIWDSYSRFEDVALTTIDLDQAAIDLVKQRCTRTHACCGDSVVELTKSQTPIDLLYLDSYDVDMALPHPAAMHCLMEFCSAKPRLREGSIVFIDDSPMNNEGIIGGKGLYVAQYFRQLGILPFTSGYQAAWLLP